MKRSEIENNINQLELNDTQLDEIRDIVKEFVDDIEGRVNDAKTNIDATERGWDFSNLDDCKDTLDKLSEDLY